jgi:hypothetical protein
MTTIMSSHQGITINSSHTSFMFPQFPRNMKSLYSPVGREIQIKVTLRSFVMLADWHMQLNVAVGTREEGEFQHVIYDVVRGMFITAENAEARAVSTLMKSCHVTTPT